MRIHVYFLLFILLILFPNHAFVFQDYPTVAIIWPVFITCLIPIVLIEYLFINSMLDIPNKKLLLAVIFSNLLTVIIVIPLVAFIHYQILLFLVREIGISTWTVNAFNYEPKFFNYLFSLTIGSAVIPCNQFHHKWEIPIVIFEYILFFCLLNFVIKIKIINAISKYKEKDVLFRLLLRTHSAIYLAIALILCIWSITTNNIEIFA